MENLGAQTSVTKLATNEGVWYSLNIEGQKKPAPRYEQGAAISGTSLYVLGGNHAGGRYLSDLWSFDLAKLQWACITTKPAKEDSDAAVATLTPCAGHSLVAWNRKLLAVGGHYKAKDATHKQITVWSLDLATLTWTLVPTEGAAPTPRGGHSTTLIGGKLFVLGGEDSSRRVVSEVAVLDLSTMTWSLPEVQGKAPPARSCHASAVYKDRYLCIFGGGSVATCFGDLHVLDTTTMTWSQPSITGFAPTARAGHAGAIVGDAWYLLGGGNNRSGCTEMLALDLSQISEGVAAWSILCTIPIKSSLSSEGISLVALPHENALVAFGGYNGKYHNTISIYRVPPQQAAASGPAPKSQPAPQASTGPDANGKTASAAGPSPPEASNQSGPRSAKDFFNSSSGTEAPSKPAAKPAPAAVSKPDTPAEEPKTAPPTPKDNTSHELSLLRHQLTTTQSQLTETKQALEQAQSLLAKEHAKSLKLEAQVAELQKKLQYASSMEAELESLREQVKESQKKKSNGGIWGYIAGTPQA